MRASFSRSHFWLINSSIMRCRYAAAWVSHHGHCFEHGKFMWLGRSLPLTDQSRKLSLQQRPLAQDGPVLERHSQGQASNVGCVMGLFGIFDAGTSSFQ